LNPPLNTAVVCRVRLPLLVAILSQAHSMCNTRSSSYSYPSFIQVAMWGYDLGWCYLLEAYLYR